MRISLNKNILENILVNSQPYLEKKDLSQITSHILIEAINNKLVIKATDFEIGLSTITTNVQIIDEGIATANGKKLLSIIKILKDDELTLEAINDFLYIKQGNSKFKLPMFNANEFPSFPQTEGKSKFDINSSNLVRSIKKIIPSIDTNNPKYELNGALIDIKENHINLVSTDTKRLALVKLDYENEDNLSLIIPKKAIYEIQKIFFDDIEIFYDENTLIAKSDNFTFFTKLINGKFPDYEKVIPKQIRHNLTLNREKMINALKQILIVSEEVKITFSKDNISFESLNDDNIEAKTGIEQNLEIDEDFYIATNSKHLLDFLSNIDENHFQLGFNDTTLPFTLSNQNFLTVVMPIIL